MKQPHLMLLMHHLATQLSTLTTSTLTLMNAADSLKSATNTLLNKYNSLAKNHTQQPITHSDLTLTTLLKNLSGLHVLMTVFNHLTTLLLLMALVAMVQLTLNLHLTDMIVSQNVMVPTLTVFNHSNTTATHLHKVLTHTHLPSNLKTTNLLVHAT